MHFVLTLHHFRQWIEERSVPQEGQDEDAFAYIEILYPARLKQSAHLQNSLHSFVTCLSQWSIVLTHAVHLGEITSLIGLFEQALEQHTLLILWFWTMIVSVCCRDGRSLLLDLDSCILLILLLLKLLLFVFVEVVLDKRGLLTLHRIWLSYRVLLLLLLLLGYLWASATSSGHCLQQVRLEIFLTLASDKIFLFTALSPVLARRLLFVLL